VIEGKSGGAKGVEGRRWRNKGVYEGLFEERGIIIWFVWAVGGLCGSARGDRAGGEYAGGD
jgi:hypothetical protein